MVTVNNNEFKKLSLHDLISLFDYERSKGLNATVYDGHVSDMLKKEIELRINKIFTC